MRWFTRRNDDEPAADLREVWETNQEMKRLGGLLEMARQQVAAALEALRRMEQP